MKVLDARQTRERLDYVALADALEDMLARVRAGQASAPERSVLSLPADGTLLIMPAADDQVATTKLVTVHPHNGEADLPTLQGEMLVMDARTGVRYGILDGATVSARRTAALSLLAARRLAPKLGASLVVVGAGTQARAHLEAFQAGAGVERVFVVSRTRANADKLVEYATSLGLSASVIERVEQAPSDTRLFVAATTSSEPVLPDSLPRDAFVAAVGAFRPDMAELPPALIAGATVVVDTMAGARNEAGDLIQAAEQGSFDWSDAHVLADAVRERAHPDSGPVLFKSVGHSLWDLAAAKLAFAER